MRFLLLLILIPVIFSSCHTEEINAEPQISFKDDSIDFVPGTVKRLELTISGDIDMSNTRVMGYVSSDYDYSTSYYQSNSSFEIIKVTNRYIDVLLKDNSEDSSYVMAELFYAGDAQDVAKITYGNNEAETPHQEVDSVIYFNRGQSLIRHNINTGSEEVLSVSNTLSTFKQYNETYYGGISEGTRDEIRIYSMPSGGFENFSGNETSSYADFFNFNFVPGSSNNEVTYQANNTIYTYDFASDTRTAVPFNTINADLTSGHAVEINGEKIYATTANIASESSLLLRKANESNFSIVHTDDNATLTQLYISPEADYITYTIQPSNGSYSNIGLYNINTNTATKITEYSSNFPYNASHPIISTSGNTIAFTVQNNSDEGADVYISPIAEGGTFNITKDSDEDYEMPSWP